MSAEQTPGFILYAALLPTAVLQWTNLTDAERDRYERAANVVLLKSRESVQLRLAIGLLTTMHPTMEIRPDKSLEMAHEIVGRVGTMQNRVFALEDTIKRVENASAKIDSKIKDLDNLCGCRDCYNCRARELMEDLVDDIRGALKESQ